MAVILRQPSVEAAYMAVRRSEALLRKVTRALDRAKVPYAVIGGHAVAAWVSTVDEDAIRFTKDVDLLVRRDALPDMTAALGKVGMMPAEVFGVHMFIDKKKPKPSTGVHLIFANERITPLHPQVAPDVTDSVRSVLGYQVVSLPALVAMKLLSFRAIDQAHIRDMIAIGLVDASLLRKVPRDLRPRLRQILVTPEGPGFRR